MRKLDRLTAVQRLFRERCAITSADLAAELECSVVTAKRAIADVRSHFGMPIEWNAELQTYHLAPGDGGGGIDLPGLWLTPRELGGLVTMQSCLRDLAPEPIGPLLEPVGRRLAAVLAKSGLPFDEVRRRVRIVPQHGRRASPEWATLSEALLRRRRLEITYHGRSTPGITERVVSPQRLVLYRGSWYLDAWCHRREALRSFAVERIERPRLRAERAKEISDSRLDEVFATAYGIFSGEPTDVARLRFSAFAARWVAEERWHPRQTMTPEPDGQLEVAFPIGRREELILDVLRWGPEVEVLAPRDLRAEVAARLRAAAGMYGTFGAGSGSDPVGV